MKREWLKVHRLRAAQLEAKSATLRGIRETTALLLHDTAIELDAAATALEVALADADASTVADVAADADAVRSDNHLPVPA